MLLFNYDFIAHIENNTEFKYIQCYCSTLLRLVHLASLQNLNTSNVIVQPFTSAYFCNKLSFKYIQCYCSTLLFPLHKVFLLLFKYIQCYCSTGKVQKVYHKIHLFKYIQCYCSTNENTSLSFYNHTMKRLCFHDFSKLLPTSYLKRITAKKCCILHG